MRNMGRAWTIYVLGYLSCQPFVYKKYKKLHWKGATIAHVHDKRHGYGSGITKKLYRHLKKIGYNSIQLNTFAYQQSLANINLEWRDPTLTSENLAREVRMAHSYGMSVILKPHIWVSSNPTSPNLWRSKIDYGDKKKRQDWFRKYTRFINSQFQVALQNNIEIFVVGTELVKLSKYTKEWEKLIQGLRAQGYQGKLTYACEAWNAKNIYFWDKLDFIGLDFYYGSPKKKPSIKELTAFYSQKIVQHVKHAKKYNRKILFTELGFPAHDDTIHKPASWGKSLTVSRNDLQKKAYRAMRIAMENTTYPFGVWLWKYVTTLESYEKNNYKTGFILENKPAEVEIQKIETY